MRQWDSSRGQLKADNENLPPTARFGSVTPVGRSPERQTGATAFLGVYFLSSLATLASELKKPGSHSYANTRPRGCQWCPQSPATPPQSRPPSPPAGAPHARLPGRGRHPTSGGVCAPFPRRGAVDPCGGIQNTLWFRNSEHRSSLAASTTNTFFEKHVFTRADIMSDPSAHHELIS